MTLDIDKITDIFNAHDSKAIPALYSADAVVYDPAYPDPLRGRDAIEQDMAEWFRAFPDVQVTVVTFLENDETSATEFSMRGTHQGPLVVPDSGEIPATGKTFEVGVGMFSRVNAEGEIVEQRRYYDLFRIMSQLEIS
jgi:steroid delta-isomerase-like uncharacterized protein